MRDGPESMKEAGVEEEASSENLDNVREFPRDRWVEHPEDRAEEEQAREEAREVEGERIEEIKDEIKDIPESPDDEEDPEDESSKISGLFSRRETQPCGSCGGSGKALIFFTCRVCGGKGTVSARVLAAGGVLEGPERDDDEDTLEEEEDVEEDSESETAPEEEAEQELANDADEKEKGTE